MKCSAFPSSFGKRIRRVSIRKQWKAVENGGKEQEKLEK